MGCTNIPLLFLSILIIHLQMQAANSSSNASCIESEWKALMEFKGSLVNDSSSLSSWTGRDCCSWHGITCHNVTSHVQGLNLNYYYFNSTLSPWLFNLTRLEVLKLPDCGLRGPIPNMFGNLTTLATLDLSGNSFYSALPDSLCNLTSIRVMFLYDSKFQGSLPACFGNLISLTKLVMGSNELSGAIPGELGNLRNLTMLTLYHNHFNSSIPSSFGNLRELQHLSLQYNQLSGTIPFSLGNLTNLQSVDLFQNFLVGELSESFFEGLKSLEELTLSRNRHLVLNVSSQWIPTFQIVDIEMESVFIGGQFPPWLQTQIKIDGISMSNANISGAIPDWFQTALPDLGYIDLSKNSLTGPIPTFNVVNNAFFQSLILSYNQFTGNIPEEICNLESLRELSLANNQLTGMIPLCLGNLKVLNVLDLANNNLFGHIPSELGSLNQLSALHINGNELIGELPSSLKNFSSLINLDLGRNQLQGFIPEWIAKEYLPKLQYLRLESNNFSGEISLNLCQLPSLQILNLAHNNLVGIIPPCLGNLSKMQSEDSGDYTNMYPLTDSLSNYMKGIELEYSSSLQYAKFLSLSGNHLHGEIPAELMNLKGLQGLNLSNNELTGTIPEKIDNLKHLESLDLAVNRLSGTIPQSLANIDALGYLNLSFNNLAGKLPLGNHFGSLFNPSIYEGNGELCGKLLMKICPDDDSPTSNQSNEPGSDPNDEFEFGWLYAGIGPGFAVGFLGFACILYFNNPWRIAYFHFLENAYNNAWVTFYIKVSQFKRRRSN